MLTMLIPLVLFVSILLANARDDRRLDPTFEIATEAGIQAFREELALAMLRTPRASPETRGIFREEAEKRAAWLFLRGQEKYKLPKVKLMLYWDQTDPTELAMSGKVPSDFSIHLNEVLFFHQHSDHMKYVIPHEVAHLLHYQRFGYGNAEHTASFQTIVLTIALWYDYKELDATPACRLSMRLIKANGATSGNPCERAK